MGSSQSANHENEEETAHTHTPSEYRWYRNNSTNNNNNNNSNNNDGNRDGIRNRNAGGESSVGDIVMDVVFDENTDGRVPDFEWMGRSPESLVTGYGSVAPILGVAGRSATVNATTNSNSMQNHHHHHHSSSSSSRSRRRRQTPAHANARANANAATGAGAGGPNVALSLLARETTGRVPLASLPASERLRAVGGSTLLSETIDRNAGGICAEVQALECAIDHGDWTGMQNIVSSLAPRLVGDPYNDMAGVGGGIGGSGARDARDDPGLPPTAPRFYAGGGRIGMEREAFVAVGGIDVLVRVFWEPCFVGNEMARTVDARDLAPQVVATNRVEQCWNEALACLRELVYSIPSLLETERVFASGSSNSNGYSNSNSNNDSSVGGGGGGGGEILPFLFTLLAHDFVFDGAAALIEEILSLQSYFPQPHDEEAAAAAAAASSSSSSSSGGCPSSADRIDPDGGDTDNATRAQQQRQQQQQQSPHSPSNPAETPRVRIAPPTTFFLGNVPDLYSLWRGFNCRQLAQFCRILALLIFEPEDRQLLESPAVLKSIELLQLRRNRAARAGRDSTVDMNQSVLLGDETLVLRLLDLLKVLNFGPALRCSSSVHLVAQYPYIVDTLTMLGLHEFHHWDDVGMYHDIACNYEDSDDDGDHNHNHKKPLHELGSVARMLENLSSALRNPEGEPINQLGHIIAVISAAQQAGVVIRRPVRNPLNTNSGSGSNDPRGPYPGSGWNPDGPDGTTGAAASSASASASASAAGPTTTGFGFGRMASVAGIWRNEPNRDFRRDESYPFANENGNGTETRGRTSGLTLGDAANILQFNALLLGPFQVEILFVLCTLLGGRRKIDAQDLLKRSGIITILDDMFQRLPWDSLSPSREPLPHRHPPQRPGDNDNNNNVDQEPFGIHGPGCECTPESALCVQYLRLLHNFCDRDCDNYHGRRLLLSKAERGFVFAPNRNHGSGGGGGGGYDVSALAPGLLSKIVAAFIGESDESPYRFWLASCVESFLRGSSSVEQVFVANTGLMKHLIDDVTSQRLHCAGSLQTSFDLLGELCKGNVEVLKLLVGHLDTEDKFRRLMSVASANLVDSNVFIRSLILSTERLSSGRRFHDSCGTFASASDRDEWNRFNHGRTRGFLTHTWLDTHLAEANDNDQQINNDDNIANTNANANASDGNGDGDYDATATFDRNRDAISTDRERESDRTRPADWFYAMENGNACGPAERPPMHPPFSQSNNSSNSNSNSNISIRKPSGRFGWAYRPGEDDDDDNEGMATPLAMATQNPGSIDRLSWFLSCNRTRLLRDLLRVVNLTNINHENICCLNTAVVITIFAHRRGELRSLLSDLGAMSDEDRVLFERATRHRRHRDDDMDMGDYGEAVHPRDILKNFREVLWFWMEYYTHRGRDRLSLEFSSRLRFHEWMEVVSLLAADDGAPTSLVRRPLRLPQSPYRRLV